MGIDVERIVAPSRLSRLGGIIATPWEQAQWLQDRGRFRKSPRQAFSLLFSAKESVYKCLRRLVKRDIEFTAVEVVRIDLDAKTLSVRLAEVIDADLPRGTELAGRFAWFGEHVLTAIELQPPAGGPQCDLN